jgi:acetyl-CoA C-acetyltransferase
LSDKAVYIVSAARTAVGNFGGGLADVPATSLGSTAIKAALERAGLGGDAVEDVTMGCVLSAGLGQAPARQASLGAGIPVSVPSATINKVCGSGLHAVILSARALRLGEADITVAGGMENMSACPHILPKARTGYRLGHGEVRDPLIDDGLWDVYNDIHMGTCADRLAKEQMIFRDEQDDYAVSSYKRALESMEQGHAKWEIAPVAVPGKKGATVVVEEDEGPKIFDEEKMRRMGPAFNRQDGTVTAGNASSINDGAAAVVLASEVAVKARNLTPLARIASWGFGAVEPARFPMAPAIAVQNALKAAGLGAEDIECWEINEAFALVPLLAMRALDLDIEKVNPLGGAISIGHPIGASGARILVTLLNAMRLKKARLGLATLCIGGGEGNAAIIEAV